MVIMGCRGAIEATYKFTSSGIVAYAASMADSALLVLPLLESIHVNTKTIINAAARIVSTTNTRIGCV